MGSGMAGRLLDAGYPLSVYNRTTAKRKPGCPAAQVSPLSPRAASPAPTVVISMLSDVPVCRDVLGRGEALEDAAPGTILVNPQHGYGGLDS